MRPAFVSIVRDLSYLCFLLFLFSYRRSLANTKNFARDIPLRPQLLRVRRAKRIRSAAQPDMISVRYQRCTPPSRKTVSAIETFNIFLTSFRGEIIINVNEPSFLEEIAQFVEKLSENVIISDGILVCLKHNINIVIRFDVTLLSIKRLNSSKYVSNSFINHNFCVTIVKNPINTVFVHI